MPSRRKREEEGGTNEDAISQKRWHNLDLACLASASAEVSQQMAESIKSASMTTGLEGQHDLLSPGFQMLLGAKNPMMSGRLTHHEKVRKVDEFIKESCLDGRYSSTNV